MKLLMATGKTDKRGAERAADEVQRNYHCYFVSGAGTVTGLSETLIPGM